MKGVGYIRVSTDRQVEDGFGRAYDLLRVFGREGRFTLLGHDVARLSPLKHRNLNVLGRCSFSATQPADGTLRPLRDPDAAGLDDDEDGAAGLTTSGPAKSADPFVGRRLSSAASTPQRSASATWPAWTGTSLTAPVPPAPDSCLRGSAEIRPEGMAGSRRCDRRGPRVVQFVR